MIEFAWAVLSAWIDVTVYKGLGPTCTSGRAVRLCSSQIHQTLHHSSLLTHLSDLLSGEELPLLRLAPGATH